MKYYIDTEFIERGHEHPIELISLAMVREDGGYIYHVLEDGWNASHANDWVKENVLPHLGTEASRCSRADLADGIRGYLRNDHSPEFWGYYCDYDWVVFCQLFGAMSELPGQFPMFCRDVKQLAEELGQDSASLKLNVPQAGTEHNALADARHIKAMHDWLEWNR